MDLSCESFFGTIEGDQEIVAGHFAFLSQMTESYKTSLSKSKQNLPPVWKQPVHSKKVSSHALRETIIDITHSNGEESDGADNGVDLRLHNKLSTIDWGNFGLPENPVIPTLIVLKDVFLSNISFIRNPASMRQIFQLGIDALKNEDS